MTSHPSEVWDDYQIRSRHRVYKLVTCLAFRRRNGKQLNLQEETVDTENLKHTAQPAARNLRWERDAEEANKTNTRGEVQGAPVATNLIKSFGLP